MFMYNFFHVQKIITTMLITMLSGIITKLFFFHEKKAHQIMIFYLEKNVFKQSHSNFVLKRKLIYIRLKSTTNT